MVGLDGGACQGLSHSLGKCTVLPLQLRRVVLLLALHARHLPVHGLGQADGQLPGRVPAEK